MATNVIKLRVQWQRIYFRVDVLTNDTAGYLKKVIFDLTGVKPHLQDFLNLSPANSMKMTYDNTLLSELNITSEFTLVVGDILDRPTKTSNRFISQSMDELSTGSEILHHSKFTQNKGTNLMVLDIDQTIFDCTDEGRSSGYAAARPYLQYFLAMVSCYYDIAIWSATDMDVIQWKLKWLDITSNVFYSIKFCLDRSDMTFVDYPDGKTIKVKALATIWNRFKEYNYKSTIICDDQDQNFLFNKRNGLKVEPYSYKNVHVDNELLCLTYYLQRVADCSNFTSLDLDNWKSALSENT